MNKSQFFKYLADGGKVKMVTFHGQELPADHKLAQVRHAEKVQSNSIMFNDGSWLYKNDVNASDVAEVAAGSDSKVISLGWAVYQLIK